MLPLVVLVFGSSVLWFKSLNLILKSFPHFLSFCITCIMILSSICLCWLCLIVRFCIFASSPLESVYDLYPAPVSFYCFVYWSVSVLLSAAASEPGFISVHGTDCDTRRLYLLAYNWNMPLNIKHVIPQFVLIPFPPQDPVYFLYQQPSCLSHLAFLFIFSCLSSLLLSSLALSAAGPCRPLVLWNLLIKSADWKTPGNNV